MKENDEELRERVLDEAQAYLVAKFEAYCQYWNIPKGEAESFRTAFDAGARAEREIVLKLLGKEDKH